MTQPYYSEDGITIFCADARDILRDLPFDVVITDPPYGRDFHSGRDGYFGRSNIDGDDDTGLRDWLLSTIAVPIAMFGSCQVARPQGYRWVLIWDKGEHVGMGDLAWPWKPNYEEIYIFGEGWRGHRTTSVLHYNAVAGTVAVQQGRHHPTEKPVSLMGALVAKAPPGVILDPFAGSGSTLVAARLHGRKAIGIELREDYCRKAVARLSQGVLPLGIES